MSAKMNSRIEELYSKLSAIARRFGGNDWEDMLNDVIVDLIEKEYNSPDFAEQKDAYILQSAVWCCKHRISASCTYSKYVESYPEGGDGSEDDEEEPTPIDLAVGDVSPEWYLIEADSLDEETTATRKSVESLTKAVARMGKGEQKVFAILASGKAKKDAAEEMGVTKARVSQHVASIRKNATAYGYVPAYAD